MSATTRFLFNPGPHSVSASVGLLILRVAFGGMMLVQHGLSKLTNFSEMASEFPDPIGLGSELSLASAVGAEVFCASLVVLGLATRWTALPLVFTMLVAAFIFHSGHPYETVEPAYLFLAAFATLVFTGAGGFSVDAAITAGRQGKR